MFLVLRKMELEDMTKFVLEFNVKWKICKGYLIQTVLKPLCVLGNQISGSSCPMCIYYRSHSSLTYIEIWRGTGNLWFSSHLSCWIRDFSLPAQLLLSLRQMLSSPCAFSEIWAVELLEMDHWTDDGFDPSFLKNKRKKPKQKNSVVAELATQQHRKFPSKVYSAGRFPGRKGMHQHHQDFILSYVDPSAPPPSNSYCWQWQCFYGHPLSMQMPLICLCLSV